MVAGGEWEKDEKSTQEVLRRAVCRLDIQITWNSLAQVSTNVQYFAGGSHLMIHTPPICLLAIQIEVVA